MTYTDQQIQDFLDGVYNGIITPYELPEDLYNAIADYLKKALYEGFGGTLQDFEGKDLSVLQELRENVYMFSAAKTFQQVKDIAGLLVDEDGKIRTQSEFNKLGRGAYDTWNNDWGKSEYNTAIAQAQQANKWQSIERDKDILTLLQYSTNGSPCPECAPYEGYAAPVDAPIWDWLYPPMHFNCMCIVEQVSESEGTASDDAVTKEAEAWGKDHVPAAFRMNSGRDKVIFSDAHPYFDVAPKDKGYAARNFDLPIPKTDKK